MCSAEERRHRGIAVPLALELDQNQQREHREQVRGQYLSATVAISRESGMPKKSSAAAEYV